MIKIIFLAVFIVAILYVLKKRSNSNIYRQLIIIIIILAILFLIATSGRSILPQILSILKIGLPFITKFIGL